jgi:UPF0716 protein FxsA
MVAVLLLLFVLVPLAELYVLIQVGQAIGALPTIGLLLLSSVLGTLLMRSQGRLVWRSFRDALTAGRPPTREIVDGALVITGGAFLLAPGFISDLIGLFLLAPPSRVLVRRGLLSGIRGRLLMAATRVGEAARTRARRDYDVDATAREIGPHHLPG